MLFGFLFSQTKSAFDDPRIADIVIFVGAVGLLALSLIRLWRELNSPPHALLWLLALLQEFLCVTVLVFKILYALRLVR